MRIDLGGSGEKPAAGKPGKSSGSGSGGRSSADKIKLIAAAVIGVLALVLIGYQVLPTLQGGTPPDPSTSTVDPAQVAPGGEEPPVPKPRGAGKRPAG